LLPGQPDSLKLLLVQVGDAVKDMMPSYHLNQFYDFVNIFAHLIKTEEFVPNYDMASVIDFLERLQNELTVFVESIEPLKHELDQMTVQIEQDQAVFDQVMSRLAEKRSGYSEVLEAKMAAIEAKKDEITMRKQFDCSIGRFLTKLTRP
jgi:predicted  nucleic acid-binding Zn-ribbon protein